MATARMTTRLAAVAIRDSSCSSPPPPVSAGSAAVRLRRRRDSAARRSAAAAHRVTAPSAGGPGGGPAGRRRGQGLTVRVAAGRAGQRQAGRTATLVAGVAGDRVRQIQVRIPALPGSREGHRQRRGAGLADAGSTSSDGSIVLGSRPRSENAASMNGWVNWPGARLTSAALKNGPAPRTSPKTSRTAEADTACAAVPFFGCPGSPAHR